MDFHQGHVDSAFRIQRGRINREIAPVDHQVIFYFTHPGTHPSLNEDVLLGIMEDGEKVDGSFYIYAPNKGAPVFFAVAFLATGGVHLWQAM